MKANEAPKKIILSAYRDSEELSDYWVVSDDTDNIKIEYVRADAFIEKVCSGIEKLLSGYIIRNFHFGDSYDVDKFIEDLKEYIKGE